MTTIVTEAESNAMLDWWGARFDIGTANPNAQVLGRDSGNLEIFTLNCSNPCMLAAATRIANSDTITEDSNATGSANNVDHILLHDRDSTERVRNDSVTVTGGGGEWEISSLVVDAGDTVQCPAGFTLNGI